MKIRQDKFKNTSDFNGRSGSATLNMDKLSLFMDSMISNYNFPELAVFREWVSNAHDAHVAAGVKAPVKVTLPSPLNPTLMVQDFGLGMTTDFVEKFYLSFGSSSKDDSDEEIGGFGQGGKSALAIASQYTMTTICNGLKNIYIFERSPQGGVDFKLVIEDHPTDEPSGTVVQVAVDRISEFNDKNINRVLAGWSNDDIELNTGKKFFSIPDNGTEVSFTIDTEDLLSEAQRLSGVSAIREAKGYVLHGALDATAPKGLNEHLDLSWDDHVVLVGPVAYIFKPQINAERVLNTYMVASMNIGDVSFPSSREVIEPTRSNRVIVGRAFAQIVKEADRLLQERADSISSHRDALQLHRSPLVRNARNFQINYKGDVIPTSFTPTAGDSIFEYQHIGNWRGVKGYKLSEQEYNEESTLPLNIETIVLLDDPAITLQSIRNNTRIYHTVEGHKPMALNGYMVITPKPSEWLKAAARTVIKASDLSEVARKYRKEQRELAAANKAAGIAPAPSERKSRKDRLGEYSATWLSFGEDEDGNLLVSGARNTLMDFYNDHFDSSKTLVLSTNNSEFSALDEFAKYFTNFSVNPKDVQFLYVNTGSKVETLRILLGDEDSLKITDFGTWMRENFSNLVTFKGRTPSEIAKEVPFEIDSYTQRLFESLGYETIHPKYSEIVAAQEELDEARNLTRGRYYDEASRFVNSLLDKYKDGRVEDRPEFYFLSNIGYYSGRIADRDKDTIRHTLNQMVQNWLDNLALEKAEAEDAAATEAKASNADQATSQLATSANLN